MRQEMQDELTRKGDLAPGQMIDALDYYEKMSGTGEVWLNQAGLPQRIKIHAVYPPLPDETEYRELELTSDYSDWQGLDNRTTAPLQARVDRIATSLVQSIPDSPQQAVEFFFSLLMVALLLFAPLLIVRYRRTRWLHQGLVVTLIALSLVEPLLTSGAVQAATERRESRSGALLAEKSQNERVQSAIEAIKADFNSNFNVHESLQNQQSGEADNLVNPAAANNLDAFNQADILYAAAALTGPDSDKDGLLDSLEAELKTDPAKQDTDGDGLDDGSEYNTLGLNPTDPDSDGDLLSDGFEVAGIQLGGKNWYLNPQHRDTNGDTIPDSLECIQAIDVVVDAKGIGTKGQPKGTGICDDSDGDKIPDFADDDNDNDGVWDWLDGQAQARFGDLTEGVKDKSFQYGIDNYSVGKPLRLTFEVRPTNPQHLWYSMNVLDWPTGDYSGQVRRVHNTTIGSTGSLANGDMQLVPMIEVTMPAAEASHLPTIAGKAPIVGDNDKLAEWLDMPVLERYQMMVAWTTDQQSLRILLPAALIRDTRGNAPVNFVAKMLYIPNGSGLFSSNHTARLVWLVQVDSDICQPPADSNYTDSCEPTGKNYQNGAHWKTHKQQIVHRYYDKFYLNAFTAEVDLAANTQIFYEKPDSVSNTAAYVPDQLLGFGTLLESYLRQNKSPAEALQAFQTRSPNASSRITSTTVIQDPDVFGLMAKVATQEAPKLLETVFKPHKEQLPYPTMLYVTWGKTTISGLAGISTGDSLKLNMTGGSIRNGTAVRLSSFAYNPTPISIGGKSNPNWNNIDPGTVWNRYLSQQSIQAYQQLPTSYPAKGRFGKLPAECAGYILESCPWHFTGDR